MDATTIRIPDDSALLARVRAGDPAAFDELCAPHLTRLLRQAMVLGADPAGAEDIVQETLVEAWRCRERYDGRCRFFTWLCCLLIRRQRSALRRRRPTPYSFLWGADRDRAEGALAGSADPAPGPADLAGAADRAARVRACLARLPEAQREVVWLRFFAGEPLEEIAVALDCPLGTVKSRLFIALERLRRMSLLEGDTLP